MTNMLLSWKNDLTKQADQNGSTPLHHAASLIGIGSGFYWTLSRKFPWVFRNWRSGVPLRPLLHADPYQLYQPDSEGLFPIHVATSSGLYATIRTMITEYPKTAGLRDSKGRTFLHVSALQKIWYCIAHVCHTPSLTWILNMRDNDGNTALHLAVQVGDLDSFCYLLMNKKVRLDLTNNKGETPLDVSWSMMPVGYFYGWNAREMVGAALMYCHGMHGYHLRIDEALYIHRQKPVDDVNESNILTSSTQIMVIGPVLIATVTFGASFSLPGGYNSSGTPTLAGGGRYIFDAFIIANTIAFLLSAAATINLMYSGMAMVDLKIRRWHFNKSAYLAFCSVTSFGAAFAIGQYLILAPVAHMTAIAICALVFLISWFGYMEPA
uniref:Uncharacterized protein n=1 Tax=Aegilops tauschii TaxID=37682 RepID=M8BG12_AEGTA